MSDTLKAKAIRAIERRFGKSINPYLFTFSSLGVIRCTDTETGSWIEYSRPFTGGRLKIVAEHDGAAR